MHSSRDSQQRKVYNAENQHSLYCKESLGALENCQVYVDNIIQSCWWKHRYPHVDKVIVYPGRKKASAWYAELNLPSWARQPLIIFHELTHVILMDKYKVYQAIPWHGTTFCSILLRLIKKWLGREAWLEMKDLFRKHKVKWIITEKRK